MANIWELSVGLRFDEKWLKKETDDLKKQAKKTGDSFEKNFTKRTTKGVNSLGSSFKKLRNLIAGAFIVNAVKNFWKAILGLWSDLEETESKFNVIFNNSKKVREEFDQLAKQTNRSRLDMIEFGSGVGNVLAPLDLAQSEVDDLSVSLVKLAVDVASFNNVSDKQVVRAFTSALSGEREALKTLGIVILDTDVKQEAYNLGLAEQGKQLTKQQKALATYNLLLKNTKNAQGDAVRTSASFANQLKGLQGAIKDVFAESGQKIANSTAWILKKITLFVSAYWSSIIKTTITSFWFIISGIGDLFTAFSSFFTFASSWFKDVWDDAESFATKIQKGSLNLWATFKLLGIIIRALSEGWISYFRKLFRYVTDGVASLWDVWTILSDVVSVSMDRIVINVTNAISRAGKKTIDGLNKLISKINKLPWVDLWFISGGSTFWPEAPILGPAFGAGSFMGATAWFDRIKRRFAESSKELEISEKNSLARQLENITDFTNKYVNTYKGIEDAEVEAKKRQEELETLYDTGYFNILDIIDKYKGWVEDTTKANKKSGESETEKANLAKEAISEVTDQYKIYQKQIEEVGKSQKKLAEDTKKYNSDISDSIRGLTNDINVLTDEFTANIEAIKEQSQTDLIGRGLEISKELAETEKTIAEIRHLAYDERAKREKELQELEKNRLDLLKEQAIIIGSTSEADRMEAKRVSGLTEAERIRENAQIAIKEEERRTNAEIEKIEKLIAINRTFADLKELTEKELTETLNWEVFKRLTNEEQQLFLSLAREKIQLTNQRDLIINQQRKIADATVTLSNSVTEIQLANINLLKDEYQSLLDQINSVIIKQQELSRSENSGQWFAKGGFTGGGTGDVAWVVHGWEWVAPNWMVKNMRWLFDSLDQKRVKWFSEWWFTTNNNKTQNNKITVNSWVDLRWFLDYAKWRL